MYPYLVADIGGTNARFALVTGKSNDNFQIEHIQILSTADHPSCESAIRAYLTGIGSVSPTAACLAIAGPIVGDRVKMTNLNWEFSCTEMAKNLGLQHCLAINDFAAVAAACGQLTEQHLHNVKPGKNISGATRAVFGPGTGLGVAGLVNDQGRWIPVPCEGGHVNLAPATAFEADVIKAAIEQLGHVSAESFISGPGLVNLYRAVCTVKGVKADELKPADITQHAIAATNDVCVETLNTFCSFAGSFAGNLALTYGAKGGIYIAGGIFPRFTDFLQSSPFVERFRSKGVMSHFVETISVDLITHPETAFVGAAASLEQALQN